jgi:phosphopantothenoylcysteine decarboxylase/phosphopantothenate--cysteine ligase
MATGSAADGESASSGREIVLGVAGGIAAYKACTLLRMFTEAGYHVRVVPTEAALRFVGEATWAALSGQEVATDVWHRVASVPHVRIGQHADLVIVAPATADLLARAAQGLADDLLTNTLLTARCPVVMAPAMHTEMWQHPATVANVATLRSRGVLVVEPASGRLTGTDTGPGRLPEPDDLFAVACSVLHRGTAAQDLAGRNVVVSAGGTREAIDPVRFIGNRSSGRQGYALAKVAAARGAAVTLVSANAALREPHGVRVVHVVSASQMQEAVLSAASEAAAVVMAAAVADFRPRQALSVKFKKNAAVGPPAIDLVPNDDILLELVSRKKPNQVVVGFAAETGDTSGTVLEHGLEKLQRKGVDLMVINPVGESLGFGRPDNEATIAGADGHRLSVPRGSKESLAHAIWDEVLLRLQQQD